MRVKFMGHEWPTIKHFAADLLGAGFIFGFLFGAIWAYYIVTGQPLDFGGNNG